VCQAKRFVCSPRFSRVDQTRGTAFEHANGGYGLICGKGMGPVSRCRDAADTWQKPRRSISEAVQSKRLPLRLRRRRKRMFTQARGFYGPGPTVSPQGFDDSIPTKKIDPTRAITNSSPRMSAQTGNLLLGVSPVCFVWSSLPMLPPCFRAIFVAYKLSVLRRGANLCRAGYREQRTV
jgi:hypothetical protein